MPRRLRRLLLLLLLAWRWGGPGRRRGQRGGREGAADGEVGGVATPLRRSCLAVFLVLLFCPPAVIVARRWLLLALPHRASPPSHVAPRLAAAGVAQAVCPQACPHFLCPEGRPPNLKSHGPARRRAPRPGLRNGVRDNHSARLSAGRHGVDEAATTAGASSTPPCLCDRFCVLLLLLLMGPLCNSCGSRRAAVPHAPLLVVFLLLLVDLLGHRGKAGVSLLLLLLLLLL